ncbi:MAG TPA: leucyl aminopeptidase, partial [Ktedonobacteraceae bacterium]|nr:leucyl aminopeptidase [Ktedonobacteraceae bacterium]
TPGEMAARATSLAQKFDLECTILEREQMEASGMGGLLAVAKGSTELPKMIILRYRGAPEKADKEVALVGKGVTFDSGGLSLKTGPGMETMKGDMAGGAAVIGAMHAIALLKPALNVTAIVPATENMPDGASFHPGDILRLMNGKTIEIVNTDAEGRLILADALSYAVQQGCSTIIDVATLTGGCHVALGGKRAGLFCNNTTLRDDLMYAGDITGEKLWPLPIDAEYLEMIESSIADVRQTGGRYGGAITAAKVLEHFVGETDWAHLDIAGLEFSESRRSFLDAGATGFGARLLATYVLNIAEKA